MAGQPRGQRILRNQARSGVFTLDGTSSPRKPEVNARSALSRPDPFGRILVPNSDTSGTTGSQSQSSQRPDQSQNRSQEVLVQVHGVSSTAVILEERLEEEANIDQRPGTDRWEQRFSSGERGRA